jgi:hypothetical protein
LQSNPQPEHSEKSIGAWMSLPRVKPLRESALELSFVPQKRTKTNQAATH